MSVLRYPVSMDMTTVDPAQSQFGITTEVLHNIYEGLVRQDADGRILPCVAERWEVSKDGLTYTFHLNPRARFHKPFDRPVTADDVKYSLERPLWPETKAVGLKIEQIDGAPNVIAGKTRSLSGVRVLNRSAVEIRLSRRSAFFLSDLVGPWLVCRDAIEQNKNVLDERAAIGTGPFQLAEVKRGARVVLEANPAYHGGKPLVNRIVRPIVTDQDTAHIMFERGDVDLTGVSLEAFSSDRNNPQLKECSVMVPRAGVEFLALNQLACPAFRDVRVRRAFAQAIDYDTMARVVYRSIRSHATGIIPPKVFGHSEHEEGLAFDPEGARRHLAEAGFPGGRGFPPLALACRNNRSDMVQAVEFIRDDLKRNLGIAVDIQLMETASFGQAVRNGSLPFYLGGWLSNDPHGALSEAFRSDARHNLVGYRSPAFDALARAADQELDEEKRRDLYQKADHVAVQDVAVIPLTYAGTPYLIKPYVQGLEYGADGLLPHYHTHVAR